jgi:murein DD-endopeptidase MepM/ murein hydrolase activator NlpD
LYAKKKHCRIIIKKVTSGRKTAAFWKGGGLIMISIKTVRFYSAIAVSLLCFGLFSFAPNSSRQPLSANQRIDPADLAALNSFQEQIKDMNAKSKQLQQEQKNISAKQKDLLGEMKTLSDEIGGLQNEIAFLEEQIAVKEDEILIMEYNIVLKTDEVDLRTEYLNIRLIQLYMDGDVPFMDVVMESANFTDFLTRFDMMTTLLDNDIILLGELREARAELEYQKLTLDLTKSLLEDDKATLEVNSAELQTQWDKNDSLVNKLNSDKAALEAAVKDLEATEALMKIYVAEIQKKYTFMYMGDGTMGWPLPGFKRISDPYGTRIHPILKTKIFHSGIDLAAPRETPVKAAETGVVIMAGSYGGYGNTVIIDHGGNVATQYSHLNSIKAKVGDAVLKGGDIGGVGTTGLSTGYHLHFEIIVNGKAVDPLNNQKYNVKIPK